MRDVYCILSFNNEKIILEFDKNSQDEKGVKRKICIGSCKMNDSKLEIKDFAAHNPMIDMLHLLKTQEIANEELKQLLSKSDLQRKELKEANRKINKISNSLEESNTRYEFVNKATSDVVWDLNLSTNEMFHGEGYKAMFGHEAPKTSEESKLWHRFIHPEDFEKIESNFKDFLINNRNFWTDEYRYLKSDGTYAIILDKII